VLVGEPEPIGFLPVAGDGARLFFAVFAAALIYVSYAYTGWNAATYLSSELEDPPPLSYLALTGWTLAFSSITIGLIR